MVREAESRAAEAAEHIEIGGFSGQRERKRGERSFPVEPGASQAGAGQEVSNGFQAVKRILWGCAGKCQ